ncbi:arginine deiminase family protein [Enorma sp.]|uniref:arginine deiminase n=1 Tax=Enorma sp. TaxID=1920692 RepID=UPI0025BAAEF2|nr:arginine deiminase family protein [Enorma sp.]
MSSIHVYSEVGKVKKIMISRPEGYFDAVRPDSREYQLVDDVVWTAQACRDHDVFANHLRGIGAEVVYLEDMFEKSLGDEADRRKFLDEYMTEDFIYDPALREQIAAYLMPMSAHDFARTVMAGIEKKDLAGTPKPTCLADVLPDETPEDPYAMHTSANFIMCRDPGCSVGSNFTINRFVQDTRNLEAVVWKHVFENVPEFAGGAQLLHTNDPHGETIEGGDIAILSPEVIAIGHSCRTHAAAIEEFAKNALASGDSFKKVVVFEIPKGRAYMHLDTVFTAVDVDKFTYYPGIMGGLKLYELTLGFDGELRVSCAEEELDEALKRLLHLPAVDLIPCAGGDPFWADYDQWSDGSNTLAVAPGVVCTYDRNWRTNDVLREHDIKVLEVPSGELCRARGGPRCMSMPLVREDL